MVSNKIGVLMSKARFLLESSRARAAFAGLAGCLALAACGSARGDSTASGQVHVVAAENFWGSLASQLGGDKASVTSIIDNPNADPHDYEPTSADGRAVAAADLVIANGVGYDPWAQKLVQSSKASGQILLTVGKLVGVADDGNPHRWYSPGDVARVIDQITADLKTIDPSDAAYFDERATTVKTVDLKDYRATLDQIKATYAGTPVGASESIFAPLAEYLGLSLLTPARFLTAVSEGTDPTAADKATIDSQIADKKIKVYVYNTQNVTPDIDRQVKAARAAGIPVATVTETLTPAGASFQQWQVAELQGLAAALKQATGR
jgi:zinc/manganese transport system substrate-binding protein